VKTLALIVRKPGLTRDAFRMHYEEVHAPLALPLMSGLVRYVRHHVLEELHGAASFDVATSFAYRDALALQEVIARLASPVGDAVLRDELTFMDKPRNRFFEVRERSELGMRETPAALRCIVFLKCPAEQSAGEFAAELTSRALPEMLDALHGLHWCSHHDALASFGAPAWDAVIQLHADADAGLSSWAARAERASTRVTVVRVSEHETALVAAGVP
jgi:uncharacterized protein (TIGR02118 family)